MNDLVARQTPVDKALDSVYMLDRTVPQDKLKGLKA